MMIRHRKSGLSAPFRAMALVGLSSLTGCTTVISPFTAPAMSLPAAFRSTDTTGANAATSAGSPATLGDLGWREVYTEEPLRQLIAEALAAGPEALLAAARLREAQAIAGAVRGGSLPQAGVALNTSPIAKQPGQSLSSTFLGGLTVSWELDLWGRYAAATEAARADVMARTASRHAVQASLVANTASLYYQIASLNEVLAVTETAVKNQGEVLRLVRQMSAAGVASAAEERQQESVLSSTRTRLPALRRQIAEAQTALAVLVGRIPGSVTTIGPANPQPPVTPPAGLPSSLLERRPDLQQANAQMLGANARLNEAKAKFYPDISLTAVLGGVSTSLSNLLTGSAATVASLGPSLLLPLYSGGTLQANEAVALARLDQAIISYRKVVLAAFGEVADSLSALEISAELMTLQQQRVTASREVLRLAELRFKAGTTGFVEVLDAQRQLLSAETDQVQSLLERRLSLGRLYLALGGGWAATAP